MARRAALAFLAAGSLLLPAALLLGGKAGEWLFAVLAALFPVALIALGAARGRAGRLGPLAWALAVLAVLLAGGLLATLGLAGRAAEAPWVAGLPLAAVIQLVALFVLPLPLVALVYALCFERGGGVSEADLDRLRRLAQRPGGPGSGEG